MILASLNIPAAFPLCRHESHNQRLFTQTKQVAEMLLRKHTPDHLYMWSSKTANSSFYILAQPDSNTSTKDTK